jgi:hypothetical protein
MNSLTTLRCQGLGMKRLRAPQPFQLSVTARTADGVTAHVGIVRLGGGATHERMREMGDRDLMRASDDDRQQVVDRLRAALEEGRLKMEEFTDRIGLAYQAVTYGDLSKLHADLPPAGPPAQRPAPASAVQPAAVAQPSAFADLPAPLKVLWTIWLAAVSINLVVWVLVVGTSGHFIYPWPVWVAGPSGAALLAVSAPVLHSRRSRRTAARLAPPDAAESRGQLAP